ncbi:hypothetical protein OH491_16905 [Termitidicoccus mucosus]|uniref:Uncharacterized protein n=1 Tax=Termitidicoccus mucosus TaxID=1184151 RepID=A0A178IJ87_9BACT|nr:hypothetical protein AW736_11685 [Opitutaceae bacterium TSB47]
MNEQSFRPPASRSDDDTLAPVIHRALRSLPGRTAPAALEVRVMAEISRRAALPWWRQSFARWPLPARALLLAASVAAAGLVLVLGITVLSPAAPAETADVLRPATFQAALQTAWKILSAVFEKLIPSSSRLWFHAVLGVIVAAYAGLLAFGGAAYRLLWQNR